MPLPDLPSPDTALTRADYVRLAREIEAALPVDGQRTVAVLASFTADFLKPYLTVETARRQLPISFWLAPYGQIEQQALDSGSAVFAQKPDAVLILPRLEDLDPDLPSRFLGLEAGQLQEAASQLLARMRAVVESIRAHSNARILLGNFPSPAWCAAGFADVSLECSQSSWVRKLNDSLAALCRSVPNALVLDVDRVASEVGLSRWRDERLEFLARAPLSVDAMSALARYTARRLRSCFVPAAKCLVLDLDNTLWGGVLGEAGIDGIQLGPDYPGNVFLDFQRRVLALRSAGILLAVASKNNAADVEQVLDQHPACLVKRPHFAAFEVHWEDKATSLRRIATTLNIGIDSLVFFDDNPAERAWVRDQLPQVTVLEVPAAPLGYARVLEECGCFDQPALTREDRQRAVLYAQDAQRAVLQSQAGSLTDFLAGLDMTLTLGEVDEAALPRVEQLLAKTNQYNLTTRRHGAAELRAMLDQGAIALWARLKDRFGDNGLIAVAIAVPGHDAEWRLDTFLMSCRVIGRGVETALLAAIERLARARGGTTMLAEYLPTAKNQPAATLLPVHGYCALPDSSTQWRADLSIDRPLPACFKFEGLSLPQ